MHIFRFGDFPQFFNDLCNGFIERLQDEIPTFLKGITFSPLKWKRMIFPLPRGNIIEK